MKVVFAVDNNNLGGWDRPGMFCSSQKTNVHGDFVGKQDGNRSYNVF
jgi:hypothetical protein